ncbi:phosphoric ester hydrolase [Aspergillus ellipticus CBS 707.79]|uniref:Phosphoric ester hydrolase n=1 Tax=Aspergillus ellipticus CBS 707.79 TaxID=1448320 RepID=A0A319DL29_9EURO|nr:phosphoric ester hydrolase [Aspergillus ellipticus CBS 707.79]
MASPFHRRSLPDYFLTSPLATLIHPLHQLLNTLRGPPRLPPPDAHPIRVVCISDTHTLECANVPDGDLLIHAGDLSNDGSVREIQATVDWLLTLPHPQKVVICGNHDSYFDVRSRLPEDQHQQSATAISSSSYAAISSSSSTTSSLHSLPADDDPSAINWGDIHYLQHSSVTLTFPPTSTSTRPRTLTLYGAPQIPSIVPFTPIHAFTYPPHHNAWSHTIPPQTDILITHTPPQSHLDLSPTFSTGCPSLLAELWRVRPALHVFGHVHAAAGIEPVFFDPAQRAWERICERRRVRAKMGFWWRVLWGWVRDLVDVGGLVDAARVVGYGVMGVIWKWVWGGECFGGAWLVNAACMVGDTGRLGNRVRVVVL